MSTNVSLHDYDVGYETFFPFAPGFDNIHGITTVFFGSCDKPLSTTEILGRLGFGYLPWLRIAPEHKDCVTVFKGRLTESRIVDCDAIVHLTDLYNDSILACQTGDCPIIMLSSGTAKAIVHSGWKGTLVNIASKVLELIQTSGVDLDSVQAAIWPGICQHCYEVGPEFQNMFPSYVTDHNHLDLLRCIKDQLQTAGVLPENIFSPEGACSAHSLDYFGDFRFHSFRRSGNGARNLVFMI